MDATSDQIPVAALPAVSLGRTSALLALYIGSWLICLTLLGFFSINPNRLLAFGGDDLNVLSIIKAYMNGDGFRINQALGFPGVQDNLYFPSFDFSYRAFLLIAARFSSSVVAPYYLMYLVGCSAMFVASAYALRRLGIHHLLAVVGAIIYVVSPYLFLRSFVHDFLSLYFSVPLGCVLALRLSQDDLKPDSGAIISTVVIGTSGLYYAFYSAIFICFVGAATAISKWSMKPAVIAVTVSTVVFVLMVLTGFGSGIIDVIAGGAVLTPRDASEQLMYGLFLPDAMSLFQGIPFFGEGFNKYYAMMRQLQNTTGFFEWPGLLLSGIIFASPLIAATIRSPSNRSDRLVLICAACIVFGLLYSIPGGYGYFFNMFVAPPIRATARVMPFLMFFALVIVSIWTERLFDIPTLRSKATACALIVAMIACMIPNIGLLVEKQKQFNPQAQTAELNAVSKMLTVKDAARVTRVLQLPVVLWPETAMVGHFIPYNHLIPFILDQKGSTTKWSYGGSVAQSEFLQTRAAIDSSNDITKAARALSFDAVLVEKLAYTEGDLAALRSNIVDAQIVFEDNERILYTIKQP